MDTFWSLFCHFVQGSLWRDSLLLLACVVEALEFSDVARRGATWRGAEYGKLVQKSFPENLTLLNLLRRRRASPQENPRTRLDVLRQHDGGCLVRIVQKISQNHRLEVDLWPRWGLKIVRKHVLLKTHLFETISSICLCLHYRTLAQGPSEASELDSKMFNNFDNYWDVSCRDTQQGRGRRPPIAPCFPRELRPLDPPFSISLNMSPVADDTCTVIIIHACTMTMVHACTMITVPAACSSFSRRGDPARLECRRITHQ